MNLKNIILIYFKIKGNFYGNLKHPPNLKIII